MANRERARERRWLVVFGGVLAVVVVFVCFDARLFHLNRYATGRTNAQIAEAQSWWMGRLDLTERYWDTAYVDGRIYSHFPPMFTLIAATWAPITWNIPAAFFVFGLVLPAVLLAYGLCYVRTRSIPWAVVLTLGLVCGTSAFRVFNNTLRGPDPYVVNHTLSVIGGLLFLIDYFGRRRVWPACIGLIFTAWSRQLTIVLAIPLLWMAWLKPPGPARQGALSLSLATGLLIAGLPMTLNALKFNDPFEPGYMYIYNDRPPDAFSRDAFQYGIFATHYIPRNLYHSLVAVPDLHRIEMAGSTEWRLRPNMYGTGILWTTPLLLFVAVDFRRIWRHPDHRCLLLAALLAYLALLCYHSTGFVQRGINRYSLDYVLPLLALVFPRCLAGSRRWIALGMIGWSFLYFVVLLGWPNLRIW